MFLEENKRKRPRCFSVLRVLVLLLACMMFVGCGTGKENSKKTKEEDSQSTYRGAIDGYFNTYKKADSKRRYSYTMPEEVFKKFEKEELKSRYEDLEEYYEEVDKKTQERMKNLDNFEWEIVAAEDVNKLNELKDETFLNDLDQYRDDMKIKYGNTDFDAKKISEAYFVKVKITVDGESESETMDNIVYKYKGKWYLHHGFDLNTLL